jgi:predicted  nucleic acid-binding Zn-ribbon protein
MGDTTCPPWRCNSDTYRAAIEAAGNEIARLRAEAEAAKAEMAKHEKCIEDETRAFGETLGQALDRAETAEARVAELEAALRDVRPYVVGYGGGARIIDRALAGRAEGGTK